MCCLCYEVCLRYLAYCLSTEQIVQQIEKTDYTDIAGNLETWLEARKFGRFIGRGAEIAAKTGVRLVKVFEGKITNLAFPAQNANGEIVGYQRAEYPAGKLYKGWYTGSDTKSVFVIDQNSDIVFMVEAVANAAALACPSYSVVALFGTSGVSNIPIVKSLFPDKRLVLWLDKGVEDIQLKAMQDYGVDGIFWEESRKKGYDQNDLIRDRPDDFEQAVEHYLDKLPKQSKAKVVKNVKESLCTTERIFNLTQAPTGVGKTKLMAKCLRNDIGKQNAIREKWNYEIDELNKFGERERPICSYITDTKKNIYEFRDELIDLGCCRKDFSVQIGKDLTDKEKENEGLFEPKGTEGIRTGNLGHFHWLGFKGHLPETYAVAGYEYQDQKTFKTKIRHGIATAYHEYLDEFHSIWDISIVDYPLCSAYLLRKLGRNEKLVPTSKFQGVKLDYFLHWPEKATYQRYEYESLLKVGFDNDSGLRATKNLDFLGIQLNNTNNREDFFKPR